MKYDIIYIYILILTIIFSFIKSDDSSYPLLDMNLYTIDDDILKSFTDFEFSKDKQDILSIQQKMKKIACLSVITKVIKESKSDIKEQIKSAKSENKNNYNKFIHNMTDTCVQKIKEKEVKQILNIENFEKKNFPFGKKEIQFEKHLTQFIEDNERIKKMEELELLRKKRNKMIINSTIVAVCVLVVFIICNLFRKKKKNDDIDKNEKKSGHKKKGKKSEKEN